MTAVCIAGMHRSGTSMVARALNLCGLYLGQEDDLLPPSLDNAEGFWENIHFLGLNDRILATLLSGWDMPPDAAEGWQELPEVAAYRMEAEACIRKMAAHDPWGWKDPRNSLTLPFWQQLIPDMKVVVCVRDPYEVALSLAKRGGASMAFSMHLWQTYYQRLLDEARPENRIITHYDAFLYDGQSELQRVLDLVGIVADGTTIDQACRAMKLSLRHHTASFASVAALASFSKVAEIYSALCLESGPVLQAAFQESARQEQSEKDLTAERETHTTDSSLSTLIKDLQGRLLNTQFKIHTLEEKAAAWEDRAAALERQVLEKQDELALIKGGRAWRLVEVLKQIWSFISLRRA